MTIKISRHFFIISIMTVITFIFAPAISVKAADAAPVHTNIDTSKKGGNQYITYKLTLDKTEVTDGRVVIGYNGDILELENDSQGIGFSEEDINTKKENGKELFSYAFVNDEKKTAGGTLITLKFKVKDEVFRQDTAIDTQIISINNEDEEVLGNTSLSDTFSAGKSKLKKPEISDITQSILGVYVSWKKDGDADGYYLYRSTSEKGEYVQVAKLSLLTTYLDLSVENRQTYYYKLVAYRGSGDKQDLSDESAPKSVTVKKFWGLFD